MSATTIIEDDAGLALSAEPVSREAPEPAASPFALGAETVRPLRRLAGLERIGERLARQLRTEIEPYSRTKTNVQEQPIQHRRFDEWRADQRDFTSLSLYRLRPLKGGMLIAIEADFLVSLVDAFYGGRGQASVHKRTEFTASEERLLTRLSDMLIRQMTEAWGEVMPLEPVLTVRETNPAYASLARPDEAVIVQRFSVAPAHGRHGTISFVYPQATLRPIEDRLTSKVREEGRSADPEWRGRMARALEEVRLPVRSVLARPELTMAQLLQLKPGDVIPINLSAKVPLLVAASKFAEGTIGEQEGRAALLIETVGKGNEG